MEMNLHFMNQEVELGNRFVTAWNRIREEVKNATMDFYSAISDSTATKLRDVLVEQLSEYPTYLKNFTLEEAVEYFEGIANNNDDRPFLANAVFSWAINKCTDINFFLVRGNQEAINLVAVANFAREELRKFIENDMKNFDWCFKK